MNGKIFLIGILMVSMFYLGCVEPEGNNGKSRNVELKKFNSTDEIKAFLEENQIKGYSYGYLRKSVNFVDAFAAPLAGSDTAAAVSAAEESGGTDYSSTNIQVKGVDEADFVKTDGRYIYVLSGNNLVIIDAYPAEDAEILSETKISGSPVEFFVNGDDLVVFSNNKGSVEIIHYDISDREDPYVEEEISVEGAYFDSRMIGNDVYVIANKYIYNDDEGIRPPEILVDGENTTEGFPDVYYFDVPAQSYIYTAVISLDLEDNEVNQRMYLMGRASTIYVSQENIYVTHRTYTRQAPEPLEDITKEITREIWPVYDFNDETMIHRISIEDGDIGYESRGTVPGHVLNQFSMDEYDGHFRIATTTGHVARSAEDASSKNHVYVLDMDLDVVGELENLAPGEKIYSARFMGKKAYLVTFRKVDPLFVIDLEDPENPEVLGKLKIPGYSDYLHPVNETHVIGLGKEAIPAEEGDFSWYQGVKLSLFDVSDVEKPKEVSKYEIGDRGTESYALRDHKAFLFSAEKDLLVIPITLAEIDKEQYPEGMEPWQGGDYTFQGAYVFSVKDGFDLRGRISHADDEEYLKSGYYWYSSNSVKRSLYIEDVLYTISSSTVKMNDLENLEEIEEIELPHQEEPTWYYE